VLKVMKIYLNVLKLCIEFCGLFFRTSDMSSVYCLYSQHNYRKCDVIADRNVLVYQSLDDGDVYAIDVDHNLTHIVVDNRVTVRLYWHEPLDIMCLCIGQPWFCAVVSHS